MTSGFTLDFCSRLARHRHILWSGSTAPLPEIGAFDESLVMTFPRALFKQRLAPLKLGRFYPAMLLETEEDFPGGMFRVIQLDDSALVADFNHPLASQSVSVGQLPSSGLACGTSSPTELLRWAGIESPLAEEEVDFADADGLARDDANDAAFYATPRKVMHVDSVCSSRIGEFYRQHLVPQGSVLDLMAGWRSHLPENVGPVTGLGMNAEEMADNPQLRTHVCHDLNQLPRLPFADHAFDTVVNTVSIEYLTQPYAVLNEVRRVLRPGGKLLVTFSNRFFPPMATNLWKRLHPVERLGWVTQSLHQAGFSDLHTLVERGLKRDPADRYAAQFEEMDPLFAVAASSP